MFPISSGQALSFTDIANYWSGEITPRVPPRTLRDTLSKAWWCGELEAANGPSRVHLLQGLYSKCANEIAFVIPGEPAPPCSRVLDGGGVEVFQLVRVPLPNAQSDTWTDANCADAFSEIAEKWDEELFWLPAYEVPFILLTRSEFIRWAEKCGCRRPTFWGKTPEDEDRQQPTNETAAVERISDAGLDSDGRLKRYTLPMRQPGTPIRAHAYYVLKKCWPKGLPSRTVGINRVIEETNRLWRAHPDYDGLHDGLTPTTVRRVLDLDK